MRLSSRLIKSTIELMCLFLSILDIFLFKRWILVGSSLAYFIFDYLRYRREATLNFQESRGLREQMRLQDILAIERKYSLREDFSSFEKHVEARTPLDRYFYYAKYECVRNLILTYGMKGGLCLDLGCGFGEDTFYLAQHISKNVIGLELDEVKLSRARRKLQGEGRSLPVTFCVGDALQSPFRSERFDTILMTEVLEHLIDPERGIENCRYLLKEGGVLIVSTPSRHNMNYTINPFLLLEKVVSLLTEKVLPPYHGLHARFEYDRKRPEPEYGIHYHFSQKQLRRMVTQNQFHVLWEGSFEIEIPPYLYLERFLKGDVEKIRKVVRPLERVLQKIPLINRFGQHLLLVAQKRSS